MPDPPARRARQRDAGNDEVADQMSEHETDPIFMEALEWLVRLNDEAATPVDRDAFAVWFAADPAHAAAFERAQALWDRFDVVKPEYERLRRSGSPSRRSLLLGGLALVAAAPFAWHLVGADFLADHRTDIGERRSFTLADGSLVELGSYSALSVDLSPAERRLTLHRGQAFFTVAADPARPFIVTAGPGTARALGTRFDVKLVDKTATVTVMEHAVAVARGGAPAQRVASGWQIRYDDNGSDQPQRADLAAVEAWRNDRIVFEDVPLRVVLRELERYRRGRILLMDESLGDMPVTAVFDTRQAAQALATIEATLPVRITDAAGYLAFVYGR